MNWNVGFIDEDIVSSFARHAYRHAYRRARACPSPCPDLVKDRSSGSPDPERVDGKKTPRITVGRGPVPRHRSHTPTIAGDRPPRYGEKNASSSRRAVEKSVPRHAAIAGAGAPELQRWTRFKNFLEF